MKLTEMTLEELRESCFRLKNICFVEKFNQKFNNEGYVEVGYAHWQPNGASCLLLDLKDGVVPLYFVGVGKEMLHLKVIEIEELEGVTELLKHTQANMEILDKWLKKEPIPAWCSLEEFLKKRVMSEEAIYEDVAPTDAFYAYSYPDDYGSGYLLFPLEEMVYICPFLYMKSGEGYVYNSDDRRVLEESDQVLIKKILVYQIKIEKTVTDILLQNRLTALFRSKN
jgi:hypothetical protein